MTFASDPNLPESLPPLRDDLQLHESAVYQDGSPCWTIQDPVNNVFYQIGWLEFHLLLRWHLGSAAAVLEAVDRETLLQPSAEELVALLEFLEEHHLLAQRGPGFVDRLVGQHRRSKLSHVKWLLHHYLFFRIPLWHPDLWLQAALPWVSWVFHRATAWVVVGLCLLGLFLTGQQIDVFAAAFVDTLSPGGLAGYLVALAVAKSLHELGHAFAATRYGVRVAHMGVAFLVLWPVLYTDTGESWRLKSRNQRLVIASAGIVTELALAGLATLAWSLAEPGDLRQALFFLASTAWLISLGLNASPFMRFDGYFILSDLLDIPNLHERSSALARTWLRNLLLGWDDPDPEHFSPQRRRMLIGFALTTWIYRLTVFLGIAFAVYVMFFKLLGIFLFLVEIAWFVVRPFVNEFKVWRQRRAETRPLRKLAAGLFGASMLGIGLVPWNASVNAAAWAHCDTVHVIYSPLPARLASVPAATGAVDQEAVLFVLEQPESRLREQVAGFGKAALDTQLAGLAALPEGEEKRSSLESLRAVKQAEQAGEAEEGARLQLRAPVAGVLLDLDPEIRPGVWVSPHQPLAVVVAPDRWIVEAFVDQHQLERIANGDPVRFYPQDAALHPVPGKVVEVDRSLVSTLPHPLLSARFGGNLPVLQDHSGDRGGLTPRDALYRVRISLEAPLERLAVHRGTAQIEAAPRSWLAESAKSFAAALIREATF